jgi:hypothetical protein
MQKQSHQLDSGCTQETGSLQPTAKAGFDRQKQPFPRNKNSVTMWHGKA